MRTLLSLLPLLPIVPVFVAGCSPPTLAPGPRPDRVPDAGVLADAAWPPGQDAAPSEATLPGVLPAGTCVVSPAVTPFAAPNKELQWRGAGLPLATYEHVISSPVVIDFIQDGPDDFVPEIIFVGYDSTASTGVLRVVSGRAPHATLMTLAGDGRGPVLSDVGVTPMLRWDAHPAAGDLDGDGRAEVVALTNAGGAIAFRADGSELWRTSFDWNEMAPNASVALADLQHDGRPEVIIGRMVLDGQSGAVRWIGTAGRGSNDQGPLSCVADIIPGGSMEIVAGRTVYDAEGRIAWQAASAGDGFCAIGDLVDHAGAPNRDGVPEVVRNAGGRLELLDGPTGALRWQVAFPACVGYLGGAPTVADFDGDGHQEVGIAGSDCYAVLDRGCDVEPLPSGCVARGVLWTTRVEDSSSLVTSSTVFDFNGDGRAEVVYNDEEYFRVLDGVSGAVLFADPNPSRTRTEQPVIADVDNDGNAEIVFGGNYEQDFAGNTLALEDRIPGLEVWGSADDSWTGARTVWNQHTYHIDNIEPTGVIPRDEEAGWQTHGSYRLNQPEGSLLGAPDLLGTTLPLECIDDMARICARVRNEGDVLAAAGITVTFYDGDPAGGGVEIGRASTTDTLEPRRGHQDVCIDWRAPTRGGHQVYVEVDGAGAARECVETNNVTWLGEVACAALE